MSQSLQPRDADDDEAPASARDWYEVLEVAVDASADDIERAFERALALVEGRSVGGYLMLDPTAVASAKQDIEAAHRVLSDPARRRRYDRRQGHAESSGPAPAASEPKRPLPDDVEAADARALLGLGDDVKPGPAELLAPPASSNPPSSPGAATAPSTPPTTTPPASTSTPPRAALRFLSPTDDGPAPAPATPAQSPLIRFDAPKTWSGAEGNDKVPSSPPQPAAPAPSSTPPRPREEPPAPRPIGVPRPMAATHTLPPTATMPAPEAVELAGEVTGAAIKQLREQRGLSLDVMSVQTKVSKSYLSAIEAQDLANLPARVYLRGFLTQVARVLKVDRGRLADGYLATIERMGKP